MIISSTVCFCLWYADGGWFCLQCFEAVGWAAGRAFGLLKNWVAWLSVWGEVQICIWPS